MTGDAARIRLDKWLWAARFFKTRALAVKAIDAGQVRIDGERVKPAHPMRVGERVGVRKSGIVVEADVLALSDRRGNAAAAALLYAETPQSVATREAWLAARRAERDSAPRFAGRPTKRDRRHLEDFLAEP
ncbi:MAG TPA: S4 domain-containing protein [Casimicrobiaceae bacterium]|nr:S4 domain-containing protein [Casimicrobiaceae bacterium]